MKFGFLSSNHVGGPRPDVLAKELEDRGFDSVWMPEHTHIPISRDSAYPFGGELPDCYWHMMDPFVSLMAAAGATSRIKLCTGICLVLQHDVLDLACTVATLDALSGGRVLLGIGVGWNEEELANHRPDLPFKQRYSAMRERVEALRTIWTSEEPAYQGRWDRFTASWVYPKPSQQPVPIALGNAGPVGIGHAAEYADAWCPIDTALVQIGGPATAIENVPRPRRQGGSGSRDHPDQHLLVGAAESEPLRAVPEPGRGAHRAAPALDEHGRVRSHTPLPRRGRAGHCGVRRLRGARVHR